MKLCSFLGLSFCVLSLLLFPSLSSALFPLNCCQALFALVIRSQRWLSRLHYENSKRSSGLLIKHYTLLQYCMAMYKEPAAFSGGPPYNLAHCQMKYHNAIIAVLVKFNAKIPPNSNNLSCAMLCQMEKMTTEKKYSQSNLQQAETVEKVISLSNM